jgi:hypothetical protein
VSTRYYAAAAAAAQRAALARALAERQATAYWQQGVSDAAWPADADSARLSYADSAYEKGEIALANRIYVRLARARPPTPSAQAAKQRLKQLVEDARKKSEEIDASLQREAKSLSLGEPFDLAAEPTADARMAQWEAQVTAGFERYDQLDEEYRSIPAARRVIERYEAKKRRQPEYARVLNEPKAKALWEVAQQHEAADHPCCAYWVYREGARLAPAPSARLAAERLAAIEADPKRVAEAKACRELQKCHQLYNSAERLVKVKPAEARGLFAQIVARAPVDSEVYRAAETRLKDLGQ